MAPSSFAKTREEKFKKAVTEKNPLALPSFEEQGASVQAKLLRLNNNPEYQKLDAKARIGVRARIYQQYVVPSFKAKGLNPPDLKLWLSRTTKENLGYIDPKDYFNSPSITAAQDLGAGMLDKGAKIAMFGINLENKALMAQFGIAHFFANHLGDSAKASLEANQKTTAKFMARSKEVVETTLGATEFFEQNHPREGFLASAPRWTGEQIAMLPFYEAVSAGMEAAGVKPIAEKLVGNISTKLASSKVGQFVGRRLYTAANIFTSSIVTGDSKKEATENAAGAAAGETILAGVFANPASKAVGRTIASSPLIKKWTANVIAMGGKPLAEEVANTAVAEATFGRLDHEGISTNTAFNGRVIETRLPKENGFRAGYFEHQGERYEYKTAEERLHTYESLEQRLLEHRKTTDPVWHSVMEAEKLSADSIALRHFNKPLSKMSQEEISAVLKRRMELIEEANYELPAHVGDLNKMDVAQENAKDFAENPIAGKHAAAMKAAGFPDVDEVVNEKQIGDIEKQTGITSPSGAIAKIERIRERVQRSDGELLAAKMSLPQHERNALATVESEQISRLRNNGYSEIEARNKVSRNFNKNYERALQKIQDSKAVVDDMLSKHKESIEKVKDKVKDKAKEEATDEVSDKLKEQVEGKKEITSGSASLNADEFLKNRNDTVAYFKNPKFERRASDGTLVGRRDKRPWNVRLKAENTAQFVETLKEADGNKIDFENPYHRMLFHWANRDKLPEPVRTKLLREMQKIVETGPHPRYNMKAADFNKEADWTLVHLQLLAQSGRLGDEGNIFHSSKFGGPENWTPWQRELQTDVEKQEMKTLELISQRHPETLKVLKSAMKKFQAKRFESDKPEDWLTYNEGINNYLKTGIF